MRLIDPLPQAVSVEAYKRAVHILPDDVDDDALFNGYLTAAQITVEKATRRLMLPRDVCFSTRASGWRRWWLPVCPVSEVKAIPVSYTHLDVYKRQCQQPRRVRSGHGGRCCGAGAAGRRQAGAGDFGAAGGLCRLCADFAGEFDCHCPGPVSYTHLDVYKRQ